MEQVAFTSEGAFCEGVIERSVSGDQAAWQELYEQNYAVARRFLLSMGVRVEVVDDSCQDVFLEAFRYLPTFRGESSFRTWLYRICATQARKQRKRSRTWAAVHKLFSSRWPDSATRGQLENAQAAELVSRALERLSETERLVFVLYELEGQSGKAVAQITETPEASVYRQLHYARKRFREFVLTHGVTA